MVSIDGSHPGKISKVNPKENGGILTSINHSSKSRLVDAASIAKNINSLKNIIVPILCNLENFREVINPDTKYIVKISADIIDRINKGELDFMRSAGEKIANIVDKTRPRSPIFQQLRISEEFIGNPQALASIGQLVQYLAIQQQLAAITAKLDEIALKAERILSGQMTDRLGFIYGAWDTYQQALCTKNEELSLYLKRDVIQTLNIGRQQLLQYVDAQDEFFRKLPTTEFGVFKGNLNGKLIKDCAEVLNSCNQALTGIGLSTVLLGSIYMSYNETQVLPVLTRPLKELIANRRKGLSHTAAIAGQMDKSIKWVINPDEFERFLDVMLYQDKVSADSIDVEFYGTELLSLTEGYKK